MKNVLISSVCALLLLVTGRSLAQTVSIDSGATATLLNQRYVQALGYESRLYNGPEYVNYVRNYINGHQFFETATEQEATVVYGGATYVGVPLRYDLIRDELVLKAPLGALSMQLVNEQVSRFTLDEHTFIRLVADSSSNSPVSTGYYDLLVDGPVRVLVSRRKGIQERSTSDGMTGEVTQKNELFISKDNHYYRVSKAKSVLALFPEHKGELRKFIRTKKLKFSAARRENAIADLVRYAATLAPPAAPAN